MERVYRDVVRPIREQSLEHWRYFVALLDVFSGYSIARFLHCKSETGEAVIGMIKQLESVFYSEVNALNCFNRNPVECTRFEGGGGYIGKVSRVGSRTEVSFARSPHYTHRSRMEVREDWIEP